MGQVSEQDRTAAASEALAWVRASLSWEHRLNQLVAEAPATAFEDAATVAAPAPASRTRPRASATVVPAVEA